MEYLELNNGIKIPAIGNGPAGVGYNPQYNPESLSLIKRIYNKFYYRKHQENQYVNAVAHSFKIGFYLLDYSASYGDGHLIGEAIKRSGVERDKLFLTTRITNYDQVNATIRDTFLSN